VLRSGVVFPVVSGASWITSLSSGTNTIIAKIKTDGGGGTASISSVFLNYIVLGK
jgi:hypothetical protein